jgi:hypothetical protein
MSFEEFKEQFLRDHDEIDILELLEIDSEDLIEAFGNRLIRYREDNNEH